MNNKHRHSAQINHVSGNWKTQSSKTLMETTKTKFNGLSGCQKCEKKTTEGETNLIDPSKESMNIGLHVSFLENKMDLVFFMEEIIIRRLFVNF
jgi:hypothetical protein